MLHIDGPVQVTISSHLTRTALVAKNLLHHDRPVHPRQTSLTSDGRYAIAVILGDAADALVVADLLDAETAARIAAKIAARDGPMRRVNAAPLPEQIMPPMPL